MNNQKNKFEIIVGCIVIIFCAFFLNAAYKNEIFAEKENEYYKLNASFDRVDGINVGSEVSISGVSIGKVIEKRLNPENYSAILTMQIRNHIKLPSDSSAEIATASLMGDKYVILTPGAETELLKDGGTIEFTQSSINIEGLITKFVFGLSSSKDGEKGEKTQ